MDFDNNVAKSLDVKLPDEYRTFMKIYGGKLAGDPLNNESWVSGLGDVYFVIGTTLAFRSRIPHFLFEYVVIGYWGTKPVIIGKMEESIDDYLILNTKNGNILSVDLLGVSETIASNFEEWVRPELLRARLKQKYESTFTAILFDDELKAEEARLKLMNLQREGCVDLEDSVVVVKEPNGTTRHHQTNRIIKRGGAGGAVGSVTGLLVGALLMHPLLGAVFGAVTGTISAEFENTGIEDHFIEDLAVNFKPGSSALFTLIRKSQPDKVLEAFQGFGGKILVTSMSKNKAAELQACLDAAQSENQEKNPECRKLVTCRDGLCEFQRPDSAEM